MEKIVIFTSNKILSMAENIDREAVKLLDGCKMSTMAIFKTTYEETYGLKIIMLTFRVFGEKLGAVLAAFSFFEKNVFNFFSNNSENIFTHFSLW